MSTPSASRRALALGLATLPLGLAARGAARDGGDVHESAAVPSTPEPYGVSHTSAAIHQEIVFAASPEQIYRALTEPAQFDQVMRFAPARRMAQRADALATDISTVRGGTFTLFGGYITGQQIELVPNERIVQAWRAGNWAAGAYSIVTIALAELKGTTHLVLDHRAFPDEEAPHLGKGWQLNYWQPLAQYFARGTKVKGTVTRPAKDGKPAVP